MKFNILVLICFSLIQQVASASSCEYEARKASHIEQSILPRLIAIKDEPNLASKMDMLIDDLEAIKIGTSNVDGEDSFELYRLHEQIEVARILLGRDDLNAEDRHALQISVNAILRRLIWNADMLVTEMRGQSQGCRIHEGEAKWDNPIFWRLRAMVFSHRVGITNAPGALMSKGSYNLAITRIEQITLRHSLGEAPSTLNPVRMYRTFN